MRGYVLKLDRSHASLVYRHAIPATATGTSARVTDNRHSAAISSGEPLAISVMVRDVSVSWPGGASNNGRLTSRKQNTNVAIHTANVARRNSGARIPKTRRNHFTPA